MADKSMERHEGYLIYAPNEMWALVDEDVGVSMLYYYNGWPSKWESSQPIQDIDEIVARTDIPRPMVDPRGLKWRDIGELIPEAIGPQFIGDSEPVPIGAQEFKVGSSGTMVVPLDKAMCLRGHGLPLSKLYYLAGFAEIERAKYGFRVYTLSWRLQKYLLLASREGELVIVIRAKRCLRKRDRVGIVMPSQKIITFTYLPKE